MDFKLVNRLLSKLTLAMCGVLIIPLLAALYADMEHMWIFGFSLIASVTVASFLNLYASERARQRLRVREAIAVVGCGWLLVCFLGSIPYLLFNPADPLAAIFESVSGFTTTGATILSEVESLPRSINVLRCLTHWLGGMGIVTLTVALLPILGVGGFQLIKAETTGPEKGKVTARITTTAKLLWIIYAGLTIIEAILLKIAGMDWVDAISHALATLGTGGFSTRNASIGGYNSVAIEVICTVFMILAGINFSLFFSLITGKFKDIIENSEFKAYCGMVAIFIIVITICIKPVYGSIGTALRYSSFQVASIMSTTGFGTADFLTWPSTAQFWIFILFFLGGCSGSTSGGIKIVRWVILCKQVNNETKKMLHPHGVFTVRLNNRVGRKGIVFNVTAFMAVYAILISITTFIGCVGKLDILSAFTGALSMVGNVGPAFGMLGPTSNYGFLPAFVKWWYCFAMLAGRLELYTMIIFFMPSYWKK